jgi:hypothetical protein
VLPPPAAHSLSLPGLTALPLPCPPVHLQEHKEQKAIVYFLTCACVDFVAGQPSWHCLLRYASACAHPCPPAATLQCGLRAVAAA